MSTALDLLDGLIDRLGETLQDFPLQVAGTVPTKFNIFRHKVPERSNNRIKVKGTKETQDDVFPFCVVKIDTFSKEENVSNQDTAVNIYIGVKNEGYEGQGYDDVLSCIQHIWNDLNENPIIAKFFKMKYQIDCALNDDDGETHPFYYGVMRLSFESQSMQYIGGY